MVDVTPTPKPVTPAVGQSFTRTGKKTEAAYQNQIEATVKMDLIDSSKNGATIIKADVDNSEAYNSLDHAQEVTQVRMKKKKVKKSKKKLD